MKNKKISPELIAAGVLFLALLVLEVFNGKIFVSETEREYIYPIATRFVAGVACLIFFANWGFGHTLLPRFKLSHLAVLLPCMVIAVNNFPFVSLATGYAYLGAPTLELWLYLVLCIGVGLFEEMAFRGCIFTAILGRFNGKRASVFWSIVASSAVFGAIHILNIFGGASPGATLLQVGYSFLIGGMCSVILVKTRNIWYCVVLHAVYNFAGGVVPQFGGGTVWTLAEIVFTALVSVAVAFYVIHMLFKIRQEEVDALLVGDKIKK